MSETIDEPGREDGQYPDEQHRGTGRPDESDRAEEHDYDLERALESVRDIEDA